jgi:hypothetical protein
MKGELELKVFYLRDECKQIEQRTRKLMSDGFFKIEPAYVGQHSEVKAQIMLAVRHIEDARMRLGKVLQYADDRVSIYDRAQQTQTRGSES